MAAFVMAVTLPVFWNGLLEAFLTMNRPWPFGSKAHRSSTPWLLNDPRWVIRELFQPTFFAIGLAAGVLSVTGALAGSASPGYSTRFPAGVVASRSGTPSPFTSPAVT